MNEQQEDKEKMDHPLMKLLAVGPRNNLIFF